MFIMLYHLILSGHFYSLEIWHEAFGGLNFDLGIFFILFEALGSFGVLIFAPIQSCTLNPITPI